MSILILQSAIWPIPIHYYVSRLPSNSKSRRYHWPGFSSFCVPAPLVSERSSTNFLIDVCFSINRLILWNRSITAKVRYRDNRDNRDLSLALEQVRGIQCTQSWPFFFPPPSISSECRSYFTSLARSRTGRGKSLWHE